MFNKIAMSAAISCAFVNNFAHSAIFLDFNGSANGAFIQDFYNGGTDSFGNRGINYGVTFASGSQVRMDFGRTYLTLPSTNVFSLGNGFTNDVTFLYSEFVTQPFNANFAERGDFSARLDTAADPGDWQVLGNAYYAKCDAYLNTYCVFQAGFARNYYGGLSTTLTFGPPPYSMGGTPGLQFAIDSITIGANLNGGPPYAGLPQASFIGDFRASVPEPATAALLGLGLLGFVASRHKSTKSKSKSKRS